MHRNAVGAANLQITSTGPRPVMLSVSQQEHMRTAALITACFLFIAGCGNDSNSSNRAIPNAPPQGPRVAFTADDGRQLTFSDLNDAEGAFEYRVVDQDQIPAEANSLHQKARQLGASGDYDGAIKTLVEAQSLAPGWPYPTYDMAFTYLLMKNFDKARQFYRRTVEMSPRGFFTAITALDALDRESKGDLPQGTYSAYMALEWISDPAQKAKIVQQMTETFPTFAPVWKEYALQCDSTEDKLAAIEKGLAANPDAETKGMLIINKALAINENGDAEAAKNILGNLALDPDTTFANEHLAKQTLSFIAK